VVVIVFAAGCEQDNRLSPAEFLAMEDAGAFGGPATQPATQPADQPFAPWAQKTTYTVGPGDTLKITISGLEQVGLPGTHNVRIDENGQVTLPSIGVAKITGQTLDEVQTTLQKAYSPKYIRETRVTAEVASYRTVEVLVVGEVRTPKAVELRGDKSSVLQAILQAGGPNDFAGSQVMLIPARAPDKPVFFDLDKRDGLVRAARTGLIQDADLLVVDRRNSDTVYVQGLVNTPGAVPLPRGAAVSALQALAAAGGTLLEFEPIEATLMRRKTSGELVRVRLDLQKMLRGKEPDLAMAPGDVLIIPHTLATRVEAYLAKNLILRAGVDYDAIRFEQTSRAIRASNSNSSSLADQLTFPSILPPTGAVGVP
jgi:polysaccharide export outer membrane protein